MKPRLSLPILVILLIASALPARSQWACENQRPEELRVRARTDQHSPGRYRINGVVVNMPEFQQAFQCKAGSAMTREDRCRVW